MKEETELSLVRDFPTIFKNWRGDMTKTCLAFGLEVSEGWNQLIRQLCEDIMKCNGSENLVAEQVKSKYGKLRFYYIGGTQEISELVRRAEDESLNTCEICGSKDKVTTNGKSWVSTLCEKCRND